MYDFNADNMISELEKRNIKYFYVEYEAMPSKIIYIEASDGAVLAAVIKNGIFENIIKVNVPSINDVLNKIVYESIFPLHGMDRISAIFSNIKAENQEAALVDKSYDEHIVPSSSDEGYLDDEDDKVAIGDVIVTSNISDKYLPGLMIGYVSSVSLDENELTKSGTVTPVVDFKHLSDVLVILQQKESYKDEWY